MVSLDRYLRHSLIDWFDQDRLRGINVIVVGAGAVGNEVLKNLALVGVGTIHIVDFDIIEVHNLTRSILFRESDVGRFKSEVAAARILEINPDCVVTYSIKGLWESINIKMLKKFDVVISCLDNYEARIALNQICLIAKIDFINLGIDSRYVSIERYPLRLEPDCCCYECAIPPSIYRKINERYSCGWLKKIAFAEKKIPTTAVTSSVAGALCISLLLQCDHPDCLRGAVKIFFDTITMRSSVVKLTKKNDCMSCLEYGRDFTLVEYSPVGDISPILTHSKNNVDDIMIQTSDKIITDTICRICGQLKEVYDLASYYDDSLTFCGKCMKSSMSVQIQDMFTFTEYELISFRLKRLPKYIKFKLGEVNYILEGGNHE